MSGPLDELGRDSVCAQFLIGAQKFDDKALKTLILSLQRLASFCHGKVLQDVAPIPVRSGWGAALDFADGLGRRVNGFDDLPCLLGR